MIIYDKIVMSSKEPTNKYVLWLDNNIIKRYENGDWVPLFGLSKEDIENIIGGGGVIALDDKMSDTSENGVKNKVIKYYVDESLENYIPLCRDFNNDFNSDFAI